MIMEAQIIDQALGADLGFACGDALGATVEFMTPKQIHSRYGTHTVLHNSIARIVSNPV